MWKEMIHNKYMHSQHISAYIYILYKYILKTDYYQWYRSVGLTVRGVMSSGSHIALRFRVTECQYSRQTS